MTNDFHKTRHLASDPVCTHYNGGLHETILHALRDCNVVRLFWLKFVDPISFPQVFINYTRDWISLNLPKHAVMVGDLHWPTIFGCAVHFLWRVRNEENFQLATHSVSNMFQCFWPMFLSHQQVFSRDLMVKGKSSSHLELINWTLHLDG